MYTELKCKEIKSRKAKQCIWCGEKIDIGQMAQARVYIYDGDFHDERSHPECWKAQLEYWSKNKNSDDNEYEPCQFKRGTTESKW